MKNNIKNCSNCGHCDEDCPICKNNKQTGNDDVTKCICCGKEISKSNIKVCDECANQYKF